MSKYNSKEKFNVLKSDERYLRVDSIHPLELRLGLNHEGKKTLSFLGDFDPKKVKNTKMLEVTHYRVADKKMVNITLLDNDFVDLFYLFCNDVIDSSRAEQQKYGYEFVISRYEKWREFFKVKNVLSENQVKGLISELLFLKEYAFKRYKHKKALEGWMGGEKNKKDFTYQDYWFEIKSTSHNNVKISSIPQLESARNGYLFVVKLEKMSPQHKGLSLDNLVHEILEELLFTDEKILFLEKISRYGYILGKENSNLVFEAKETTFYKIDDRFPKITENALPKEVQNVTYELVLNMLLEFKENFDDIK